MNGIGKVALLGGSILLACPAAAIACDVYPKDIGNAGVVLVNNCTYQVSAKYKSGGGREGVGNFAPGSENLVSTRPHDYITVNWCRTTDKDCMQRLRMP